MRGRRDSNAVENSDFCELKLIPAILNYHSLNFIKSNYYI